MKDETLSALEKRNQSGRTDGAATRWGQYATAERADAEVELIVTLYFDGLSLTKIGAMLGRPVEYVSRVFHSPKGKMLVNQQKRTRQQLAAELQDRTAYAAQSALDRIIELAQAAGSEAVSLRASEKIVDMAMPQQAVKAAIQVNIGDEAIDLAVRALREVDSYAPQTVEVTPDE
jgi:hypothetical protein